MATINGTFNSLIAGTLSGTIGTPGPTGATGPQGPAGPTFTGGPITSPITYDAGTNSTAFENGDVFAQDNTSGSYGAIYTGGLQASNGALTIDITGAGITFGDSTVQSTAFPGSAAFYPATGNPSAFLTASALTPYLLSSTAASTYQTISGMSSYLTKAGNLSGLANTATARSNLGLGTMATATASDYLTVSAAAAGYYPLTGNPSAFLTASALTGYATESFVTSQGYIGDAPSDGSQYARQDGAWEVVTGGGGGSYLPLAGGTMTGAIVFDGTSGQYISKGNFDTSRGGNYGISLVCSIGYEFNWQAGWLTTTNQGSVTPRPLYLDSLAGTTLRSWNSETDTGTEVAHTGINVGNTSPYYVNVAPDLVKVFEATNELGVSIAHDSISIQHIDTPDRTSYFTNEYIGFEDMSGTPHSAWIEHDVITVQDATDTTQMRSTGISLSAAGSITFGDSTVQTTAYTGGGGGGIPEAPLDGYLYARVNGGWMKLPSQNPAGIFAFNFTNISGWVVGNGDTDSYVRISLGTSGNVSIVNAPSAHNNFTIDGGDDYGSYFDLYYLASEGSSFINITFTNLSYFTTIPSIGIIKYGTAGYVNISNNAALTSITDLPSTQLYLSNNPSLSSVPSFVSSTNYIDLYNCAISDVYTVLSNAYSAGASGGYVNVSGGTNQAVDGESGQVQDLINNGWTVIFNSI